MSERDNLAVIENGYKALAAGALDAVFATFADDIEAVIPGESRISGTHRGKTEVGEFLAQLAGKGFTTAPDEYFAAGDQVVVVTNVTVEGRAARQVDIWTVRDGKATNLLSVGDTRLAVEVFGRK